MGGRGRQSSGALATAKAVEITVRPDACYSLRDEEAEVWKSIVESLPADWITPGSAPILAGYCRATVSARRIGQLTFQAETEGEFDPDFHMRLVRAHSKLAATRKALATSSRLKPQARYTPQRAGTLKQRSGPAPWQ